MRARTAVGFFLLGSGLLLGAQGSRPWIDLDFPLAWYGLILILDGMAGRLGARSILSDRRGFLGLILVSAPFWWFYEWTNLSLKAWDYRHVRALYTPTAWGLYATASFTTVLPAVAVSTNFVGALLGKLGEGTPQQEPLPNRWMAASALAGAISFGLSILAPGPFFVLVWFVLFLVLDPLNARLGRTSLIAQIRTGRYTTAATIALGTVFCGFLWESLNVVMPKWTYPLPLSPWFWRLPEPISTKLFELPLSGYLAYIPHGWSSFAYVTFVGARVPWLVARDRHRAASSGEGLRPSRGLVTGEAAPL